MRKYILKKWFYLALTLIAFFSFMPSAFAVEGVYLGGHVGHVALSGGIKTTHSNTIGFGVDLGLQVNPGLDVLLQSQFSSHSGTPESLKLFANTLDANIHFFQANDFDFTLQAGPGFYSFSGGSVSETKFGLNFGVGADIIADESLRVGLDWRYHVLLGTLGSEYNYWSTMMRIGYWFGSN